MKSDYNRTYEFPPIAVAIPPCEFSVFVNVRIGLYISSVKIPNGKIFKWFGICAESPFAANA